ncbi:MAG: ubiquitin carboxyl-terminal hydrolase [Puniceicoccales bacterium]|jgi:ubiquitin C-terminal hydrolase|nr:ubiquitin carboxyl-terminal hydrolase [Puniceicoccales bacterium]
MEPILLCQEQMPTASMKDLIKPSKSNLRNFDNHCYLNAVLQMLFAVVPFRNEVMASTSTEDQFTQVVKKIFHYLATGKTRDQLQILDHDLSEKIDKIASTYFRNGSQEDVVNLLLPFLEGIREETHTKKLPVDGLVATRIDAIDPKDNYYRYDVDIIVVVPIILGSTLE